MRNMLTQARLKQLLKYDPETGIFTRLVKTSSNAMPGAIAGYRHRQLGYVLISVDRKSYYAHRLAWLFVYGSFPSSGNEIDHLNHIRDDNRISNLREVTQREQATNKPIRNNSTTGLKGVSFRKDLSNSHWAMRIYLGPTIYQLYFSNKTDAAISYNYHAAHLHGEFAYLNKIYREQYIHD